MLPGRKECTTVFFKFFFGNLPNFRTAQHDFTRFTIESLTHFLTVWKDLVPRALRSITEAGHEAFIAMKPWTIPVWSARFWVVRQSIDLHKAGSHPLTSSWIQKFALGIAQFHGRSARQTEPTSFVPPRHQLRKPSHLLCKSAGQLNGELELYIYDSFMINPFE